MSDRRRRPKPFVKVDYPSKRGLSESEAMGELRRGPSVAWFGGWVGTGELTVTGEVLRSWQRYELLHIYYDAKLDRFVQESRMLDDAKDFRIWLGILWGQHNPSGRAGKRSPCCRPGNEHFGTFYFVYPARPYTEIERDEDYHSSIGAMRFAPREGDVR